jgi:hypothetical protein
LILLSTSTIFGYFNYLERLVFIMRKRFLAILVATAMIIGFIPTIWADDVLMSTEGFTITFIDPDGKSEPIVLQTDSEGRLPNAPIMVKNEVRSHHIGNDIWRSVDSQFYAATWHTPNGKATWNFDNGDIWTASGRILNITLASGNTIFTEDTVFHVENWIIHNNMVVLTFDANGGSLNPTNPIVEWRAQEGYFTSVWGVSGEIPIPTRPGYVFQGWFSDKDGGILMASNSHFREFEHHGRLPENLQNKAIFPVYARWIEEGAVTVTTTTTQQSVVTTAPTLTITTEPSTTTTTLPVTTEPLPTTTKPLTTTTGSSPTTTTTEPPITTTQPTTTTTPPNTTTPPVTTPPPMPPFTPAIADGEPSIGDALQILMFLAGLPNNIDVSGGRNPTIDDALQILMKLAGLPSVFD